MDFFDTKPKTWESVVVAMIFITILIVSIKIRKNKAGSSKIVIFNNIVRKKPQR